MQKNTNKFISKELINFSLFSIGKLISVFGSAIYTFAIGLYVLKTTGSGLSFALTLTFGILPIIIFGPIAGVMADKFDKKKTIVITDLLNGFLFLLLFLISNFYEISLAIIYASAFISTTLTTIFNTSIEAAKPHLVSDERLLDINSSGRIIDSTSAILGPVLGGIVFAFIDLPIFMLINGVSFIASAILEYFIDFKFNYHDEEKTNTKAHFINDIIDGLKYIMSRKDIVFIIAILIAVNFFLGLSATVALPYIINTVLKLSVEQFGVIEAAFPTGIIIGALFVKKVMKKHSTHNLLVFMSILLSGLILLLGVPLLINYSFINIVYFIYYLLLEFAFGVVISFIDIPLIYDLQISVPDEYRGRVLSIGGLGKIVQPIAFILSGFLLNTIHPSIVVMSGGALLLISTIAIMNVGVEPRTTNVTSLEYD